MKIFVTTLGLFLVLFTATGSTAAQDAKANAEFDKYMNLLRKDLRSGKKQFVAANLTLTDAEAQKFWPIYDQYAAETEKLYSGRIAIVKEYAASVDNLTDATAAGLNKRSLDSDAAMARLRQKYVPLFAKALDGKTEALFFQIDKRLALLIDLQLASEIPLVEF
jgi:hypothetical protein